MGFIVVTVLIILVCIVLILSVLVQNPKGGGLSASFGGMGNQVMGARKATDFIEKTTWVLAVTLLVLSLVSGFALPEKGARTSRPLEDSIGDEVPTEQVDPTTPPSTDPTGPVTP